MKIRLDQYLCQNGLAQSRERAKALIMAGIVYVGEEKSDKPGNMVDENAHVEVRGHDIRYVSRGGLKLEKAMQVFPLTPEGKVCMDIGRVHRRFHRLHAAERSCKGICCGRGLRDSLHGRCAATNVL